MSEEQWRIDDGEGENVRGSGGPAVGSLLRRHSGHPGRRMMKSRGEGVERDGEAEGVDNEGEGRSWVCMLGFCWEQNYQIALLSLLIYFST